MSSTTSPEATPAESRVRARTRRAILTAAASLLARNRAATLAEIAEAADVGRTSLHRYFPDRETLINAVVRDSASVISRAVRDARLDDGDPVEAMRRLVAVMLDVGDHLLFLFSDPGVRATFESLGEPAAGADPVADLIERGRAQGAFDPQVSGAWIQGVFWALLYAGCDAVHKGRVPRHQALHSVLRSLENGIRGGTPEAGTGG
ncbi:TetR/AcrR family transcriptional regulator [Microbispora sp. NPDC088329]|uniref:TetR/AcrR family transcriptional regulator n=1 Tax=unclassified Microbispora TaxID=2614687 RepID=UPI00342D2FFC